MRDAVKLSDRASRSARTCMQTTHDFSSVVVADVDGRLLPGYSSALVLEITTEVTCTAVSR